MSDELIQKGHMQGTLKCISLQLVPALRQAIVLNVMLLEAMHSNCTSVILTTARTKPPSALYNCISVSCTVYSTDPSPPRKLSVSRVFDNGIELNWLPPTEPNGEVLHYVIDYTPEGGTKQSFTTENNLTHYNLTGLEMNSVYTNIAVQAVNSAGHGRSDRSAAIAQYNHTPPGEC